MTLDCEANFRNLAVLVSDDIEVLISFHTVETDNLYAFELVRSVRRTGETSDVITDDSCRFIAVTGDVSDCEGSSFSTSDIDNRHKVIFNNGSTSILAQISVLINLRLDFRRDEVSETAVSDGTCDSRLDESYLRASHRDFIESLGHIGESLEVCRTDDNLECLGNGIFDDFLFNRAGELATSRTSDFVSEGFNVAELVPCIEFDGSVLVLKRNRNSVFSDSVRRCFETVMNFTRIGQINGIRVTVLFTLEFALGHVRFCFLGVRHVVVNFTCD